MNDEFNHAVNAQEAAPSPLAQLAKQYGLGEKFYDFRGECRVFSDTARGAILQAMGAPAAALTTSQSVATEKPACLPAVVVRTQQELHIDINLDEQPSNKLILTINTETKQHIEWQCEATQLQRMDDGSHRITLPADLPLGYHQLEIKGKKLRASCKLIIAPTQCYLTTDINEGARHWGLSIQLYTLRSSQNWGIGDFADLRNMMTAFAPHGCALVGLNPLHALRIADPRYFSPYSPSSRQFINVLYIAITEVAEYANCVAAQQWVNAHQTQLMQLRATSLVNYTAVAQCKFTVLPMLFEEFQRTHLANHTEHAQRFHAYVEAQGEALRLHALYDALDQHFSKTPESNWGWRSWPEPYHDPHHAVVKKFAKQHVWEVEYFMYLQWVANTQLQAAQAHACAVGMKYGVYADVAVGVDTNGSEVWSNRSLHVEKISVGAPPDPLALKGQDWGIPPQHPLQMQAEGYQTFSRLLRANMQAAGALRIDHVMSLCRLWWVPHGMSATEGVYVHYPLHDLIKVLALESVRNRCVVIGEDLGVVPNEVREALKQFSVLQYKVLFFEKLSDGQYIAPDQYPRNALAVVTTHDLPLLKAWWTSADIRLQEQLHHYPDEATLLQVKRNRERDRHQLMQAMVNAGLWHWQAYEPLPEYSHALLRAAYVYAGLTNAALLMVQPEDLLHMTEPVNVPGTNNEYPNWQRKLTEDLDILSRSREVQEILQALNKSRSGNNPNAW